jgi:hypothetical protein
MNRLNAGSTLAIVWLSLVGLACFGSGSAPPPAVTSPAPAPVVPAVAPAAPAADLPASFGVAECDHYAQVACGCSNSLMQGPLCNGARQSFDAWRTALESAPTARETIASACAQMEQQIAPQCQ